MSIHSQVMQVFAENYDRLILIAKNNLRIQHQTENYEYDVVSHFLIGLNKTIKNDNGKFEIMIKDGQLVGYLCRSVYRNCVLDTAPYIRDLKKSRRMTSGTETIEICNEILNEEDRCFIELIEVMYDSIEVIEAEMFLDYCINEFTINELALKYDLSMSRTVNKIESIKTKLKEVLK